MSIEIDGQIYTKMNLGCGNKFFPGYLNVGFWADLGSGLVYKDPNGINGAVMLNHDLSQGIPAEDNSLDVIYHSHFIEHLSYQEAWAFLKECYRVLKPGGIHRAVVPDLEVWINAYNSNNKFLFEKYLEYGLRGDSYLYGTKAAVFMGMLHNHGHKCGWDYEMLHDVLSKVGFCDIKRVMWQESDITEIAVIEPYEGLRCLESFCVESTKEEQ
jgi:ubiquinone/menaquinone biosynthesis C-methylase UbiE